MTAIENPTWYRALAARCRALAEQATDPQLQVHNRAEAERWLRLAEEAEKCPQGE